MTSNMTSTPKGPMRPLQKTRDVKHEACNIHHLLGDEREARMQAVEPRDDAARHPPSSSPAPRQAKRKAPPPPSNTTTTMDRPPVVYVRPAPPPPSTKPSLTHFINDDASPVEEDYGSKMLSRCLSLPTLPRSVLNESIGALQGDILVSTPTNNEEATTGVLNDDPYHYGGSIVNSRDVATDLTDIGHTGTQLTFVDDKFSHGSKTGDTSCVVDGVVLRRKKSSSATNHQETREINGGTNEELCDDVFFDIVGSADHAFQPTCHDDDATRSQSLVRDSTYEAFAALDEAISSHSYANIYEEIEFVDGKDETVVAVNFLGQRSDSDAAATTQDKVEPSLQSPVTPSHHRTDAPSAPSRTTPKPAPRRLVLPVGAITTFPQPSTTGLDAAVVTLNRTVPRPITRKAVPLTRRELESIEDLPCKAATITHGNNNRCAGDGTSIPQITADHQQQLTSLAAETGELRSLQEDKDEASARVSGKAVVSTESTIPQSPSNELLAPRELQERESNNEIHHDKLNTATERGTVSTEDEKLNWDPKNCFTMDDIEDPQIRLLFENAGVTDEELRDANTRDFIYRFLVNHGGMEAVKREAHFKATLRLVKRTPRTQTPRDYVPRRDHQTYL